jgi:hypothetical protein
MLNCLLDPELCPLHGFASVAEQGSQRANWLTRERIADGLAL